MLLSSENQTQARLGLRKNDRLSNGVGPAFFKAGPPPINASQQPKSCCYTGTQAPNPYRPLLAARVYRPLETPLQAGLKFLVQYIAPEARE
jgi:hypothetical protein